MKKSLIALAVASAFAAPAFAATGNVDVYGQVRVSVNYTDPAAGASGWTLTDRSSRLGFKGSEDLGGGLKAIWQVESQFNAANTNTTTTTLMETTGQIASRNTFVGLSGGFGTFLMGRHDSPYKLAGSADLFADTGADSQSATSIIGYDVSANGFGGFDARLDNAIAYITPDFNGFHAAIATGVYGNDLNDAMSLALVYVNGPLKLTAGWEDHNNLAAESAWKVNAAYTMGDLALGATYEDQDGVGAAASKNYLVSAAYNMGPITLALQYGNRNVAGGTAADLTRWTAGAIYNLSKRSNVAVAYNDDKIAAGHTDTFTVQLNHSF